MDKYSYKCYYKQLVLVRWKKKLLTWWYQELPFDLNEKSPLAAFCLRALVSLKLQWGYSLGEFELINSLFQVAARRSLPALQVATRKLHVTPTTKAAEISSILEERILGAAPKVTSPG